MPWCVVNFIDENTVECVPHGWYVSKSEECFWPPNKTPRSKIQEFIRQKHSPTETWRPYKVKLLGRYDDIKTAFKKARKAEYFDELTSQAEELPDKRPKKKNKRYRSQSSSDSAQSPLSSESELEFPITPKFKRNIEPIPVKENPVILEKHVEKEDDDSEKSQTNPSTNYEISLFKDVNKPSGSQVNSSRISENAASPVYSCHSTPTSSLCFTPSAELAENTIFQRKNEDFRQRVVSELNILNTKVDLILDTIQVIIRKSDAQKQNETIKKNTELHTFVMSFPLVNTDELQKLENWLAVEISNIHCLSHELSRIGGSSVKDLVRRIMYKTFHNNLGMKFTWEGAHQKLKFKNLNTAKAILEIVRTSFPSCTDLEVINYIKLWLVRCKDREQKKEPKSTE